MSAVRRQATEIIMKELIQILEGLERDSLNMVLTVVGPELTGEKCLLADGKLLWESEQGGFFAEHLTEAAALTRNGICPLEGKQVLCERVSFEKKLVVCGAGHVGQQVIRIGRMLEMEVTVLEDREEFAGKAREAGAQRVLCGSYTDCMKQVRGSDDSYFVVLTHGHRCDRDCVQAALEKKHAYVGMIGSRRHGEIVKESLAAGGMAPELLDELHLGGTPAFILLLIGDAGIVVQDRDVELARKAFDHAAAARSAAAVQHEIQPFHFLVRPVPCQHAHLFICHHAHPQRLRLFRCFHFYCTSRHLAAPNNTP